MSASFLRTSFLATSLIAMGAAPWAVACSSDPAPAPAGGDAGVADGSSGGDATGPDGGGGGIGSCGATAPVTTLGTVDVDAFEMINAGDYLVLRDSKVGLDTAIPGVKTGGLIRFPKAAGVSALALAPTAADRRISGYHAEGNILYAIDYKAGTPVDTQVVKKTLPDGAVEPLGITGLFDGLTASIVASDAANLYFRAFPSGGGNAAIYRAPKAGGAAELVTKIAITNADVNGVRLLDGTLWFFGAPAGSPKVFYTAPATGNDVAPTKIDSPNKCFGNILIAASGVACMNFSKVYGYDLTFANEKVIFDSTAANTTELATPRLIDGTRVILTEAAATPSKPIRAVPIGGGPVTEIACDRATIQDIFADDTHFYWHEDRDVGGTKTSNVYKMAK